jgi:hypothetical protein
MNLQSFEQGVHENSPSQHTLLQKQNGMKTVDINNIMFDTNRKKNNTTLHSELSQFDAMQRDIQEQQMRHEYQAML